MHAGDCLDVMAGMPDASVDLILSDPPYFRAVDEPWDKQWGTAAGFLDWLGLVCDQWARLLRPDGSLYCFASPRMAARVELLIGERFNVLNHIVWAKPSGRAEQNSKEAQRAFFPQSERIIFAEHYNESLRAYLDGERQRAGVGKTQIQDWMAANGYPRYVVARHAFGRSQWELPTEDNYNALRRCFHELNHGGEYLRRDYEDLRRPFAVTPDVPYTDVWSFAPVQFYPGKHLCEKPQDLLQHIVASSSRPGGVVLDCFAGSGATGLACLALGREFIGVDASPHWYEYASLRLENYERMHAGEFRVKRQRAGELDALPLFGGGL